MKKTLLAIVFATQFSIGQILADETVNLKNKPNTASETKSIPDEKAKKSTSQKEKTPLKVEDKKLALNQKATPKKTTVQVSKSIVHVVEPKQTLFFLLKKYNTTETDFLQANPGFDKTMPMKIGQKLTFVPKVKPIEKEIIATKPKAADKTTREIIIKPQPAVLANQKQVTSPIPAQKPNELPKEAYHIVQAQETIFSLSKKYNLDITEFVEANNLTDNVIKPGQKLIINKSEITKQKALFQKAKEPIYVQKQVGKKVVEEGIAQVVKTKSRTNKFLALHRTAKSGSIIKVTNEANGTAIYAKIVGNMNAVGPDQHIMLKLSPLAYYQLKPKDSKMRAKIEYFTPM